MAAKLALEAPGQTLVEYSQELLGKPLGIMYSLFLAAYFFSFLPVETRVLQELVNISPCLQRRPGLSWFFHLCHGVRRFPRHSPMAQVNELLIEIASHRCAGRDPSRQHFEPIHLLPFSERSAPLGQLKSGDWHCLPMPVTRRSI